MSVRSFFDTNILLYIDDRASPSKRECALDLFATHRRTATGVVSLQVLQEYFVVATRKFGLDAATTRHKVEIFARLDVVTPGVPDILAAIDLHRLHAISFWDALIVHCAKQAGCRVLLTEDLQHRRELDGLRIENPFRQGSPE